MTAPKEPMDFHTDTTDDCNTSNDMQDEALQSAKMFDTASDDDSQACLSAARAEINELQETILRARAEVENIRRRSQEDVSKAHKFSIEAFSRGLLPVKDSLEQALAQPEQTLETLREGVEITLRQLSSAFEGNRLEEILPVKGDKFDPHLHQAISSLASEQPANTVILVLQKGYRIAERVLRPALVTVAQSS